MMTQITEQVFINGCTRPVESLISTSSSHCTMTVSTAIALKIDIDHPGDRCRYKLHEIWQDIGRVNSPMKAMVIVDVQVSIGGVSVDDVPFSIVQDHKQIYPITVGIPCLRMLKKQKDAIIQVEPRYEESVLYRKTDEELSSEREFLEKVTRLNPPFETSPTAVKIFQEPTEEKIIRGDDQEAIIPEEPIKEEEEQKPKEEEDKKPQEEKRGGDNVVISKEVEKIAEELGVAKRETPNAIGASLHIKPPVIEPTVKTAKKRREDKKLQIENRKKCKIKEEDERFIADVPSPEKAKELDSSLGVVQRDAPIKFREKPRCPPLEQGLVVRSPEDDNHKQTERQPEQAGRSWVSNLLMLTKQITQIIQFGIGSRGRPPESTFSTTRKIIIQETPPRKMSINQREVGKQEARPIRARLKRSISPIEQVLMSRASSFTLPLVYILLPIYHYQIITS
jgi:hypothetical protein